MSLEVVHNKLRKVPKRTKKSKVEESVITWQGDSKIEILGQEYQALVNIRDLVNMLCATINQRMLEAGVAKQISRTEYDEMLKKEQETTKKPTQEELTEAEKVSDEKQPLGIPPDTAIL